MQIARQHERDARVGVRRIFPEHAAALFAAGRAGAGDQQPGRRVGDAGDEVGGVELGRIDEHGDGGVGDVAAQHVAHALAQARARDARLGADAGDEQRRRQRRAAAAEHLNGDRVRVFDLLGAGEHARRRAADDGGARDGAAHGAEHARVFVVVVLDAGEDDRDLGGAHAGGGERAVRGQACGGESVEMDGDSDSGRGHGPPLTVDGREKAKAVVRPGCVRTVASWYTDHDPEITRGRNGFDGGLQSSGCVPRRPRPRKNGQKTKKRTTTRSLSPPKQRTRPRTGEPPAAPASGHLAG